MEKFFIRVAIGLFEETHLKSFQSNRTKVKLIQFLCKNKGVLVTNIIHKMNKGMKEEFAERK